MFPFRLISLKKQLISDICECYCQTWLLWCKSWLPLLLPLLADLHLCLFQLLRVECVSFCQELLPLLLELHDAHTVIKLISTIKSITAIRKIALGCPTLTHRFFFTVHDCLQLLKVAQLYLQLLHLCFHQQSHKRFDLPLFYCRQMLQKREKRKKGSD